MYLVEAQEYTREISPYMMYPSHATNQKAHSPTSDYEFRKLSKLLDEPADVSPAARTPSKRSNRRGKEFIYILGREPARYMY